MKVSNRILIYSLILLTLSLIGSITLNFIIYNAANRYYRQVNSTRLDPLGLNVYQSSESPAQTIKFDRPTVLFFGDSRASAWTHPSDIEDFNFINRGIGAQTTAQVQQRFDRHVAPLAPDILILQVGVNDLKTIPLFPQWKDEIIERCKRNIQQIVTDARQQNSIVILSTIFPLGKLPIERKPFWSEDVDLAIEDVNTFIESLADRDAIVFQTKPILAGEGESVKDEYRLDFLHINETGYAALNRELVSLLQTIELTGRSQNRENSEIHNVSFN